MIVADLVGRDQAAVPYLVELAELLAIPVVDKGGSFNFPNTHPLDATAFQIELLPKADLLLGLELEDPYGSLHGLDKQEKVLMPDLP